jgi:5-methylcytosine-specific restriction endonuclease McrA
MTETYSDAFLAWERKRERECERCGAKRWTLFVIWYWQPPSEWQFERWPEGICRARRRCADSAACEARYAKKQQARTRRNAKFVIELPKAPGAKLGTCRWCGATLTGENAERRNYCYPTREGRECRWEWERSTTWDPRIALIRVARRDGVPLVCVDCGVPVSTKRIGRTVDQDIGTGEVAWDADHEIPLEDGGEHTLENLRCRCKPCHKAKTAREATARAARRKCAL